MADSSSPIFEKLVNQQQNIVSFPNGFIFRKDQILFKKMALLQKNVNEVSPTFQPYCKNFFLATFTV
jgi:hypothetical protein